MLDKPIAAVSEEFLGTQNPNAASYRDPDQLIELFLTEVDLTWALGVGSRWEPSGFWV